MRGTSLASLAACLGLTLGGCAIPPSSPYASLAYQQVAPGWTLTVHEPLRVPAAVGEHPGRPAIGRQ